MDPDIGFVGEGGALGVSGGEGGGERGVPGVAHEEAACVDGAAFFDDDGADGAAEALVYAFWFAVFGQVRVWRQGAGLLLEDAVGALREVLGGGLVDAVRVEGGAGVRLMGFARAFEGRFEAEGAAGRGRHGGDFGVREAPVQPYDLDACLSGGGDGSGEEALGGFVAGSVGGTA